MTARALEELEPSKREVVRELLRGASEADVAWAVAQSPERVVELAHEALAELAPDLAADLSERDRRRVAGYLLQLDPPGQAAGTWELLEAAPAARRWAAAVRAELADLYGDDPPAIPEVDSDAQPPQERARGERPRGERGLRGRRAARARSRELRALQAAALELRSPFRREALEAHREGSEKVKLPHFASRRTRLALYALLVVLLVGLVMAVVVKIPTFTPGTVLVTEIPPERRAPVSGLGIVALFAPELAEGLEAGRELSVQLPNTTERVSTELLDVSERPLSPREIVARFRLPRAQANRVLGPAVVAVAELRTPPGAPPRERFAGAVASEADARIGERRVISLVAP
ncbi:MAG TPA: hypothetical protein VG474_16695 [Solirubrobacteraceae bacterium]|nr:hypothetical protein [Solirubrobacteraceae bacterium]